MQLELTGKADGTIEELLAYYPNPDTTKTDLVAGKLNVVSYDLVNKNLVLITVNATTPTLAPNSLQTELNNIYSQGVVQWTVHPTQSINVNGIDENALDDGGSGLLSNYTEDMKKILRAYTADHAMADNTYYLFLVKNSTSQSKLGYMPRKKQAGFIFVDAHYNADVVKTIAHELGHGAFHLKHTFSEYPSLSQGVTENLMDYPAKTRLDKWQWDHIHNPESVLGLFEGDDEGALSLPCLGIFDECREVIKMIEAIKVASEKDENILIMSPAEPSPKVWEGYSLKVGGVDFDKISIVVELDANKTESVKARSYEDYSSGDEYGFVYKNGDRILAKILITTDDDRELEREKLRAYLFNEGSIKQDQISRSPNEILIYYKRLGRNDYRTWGEFTILGSDYRGYVLERPKGKGSGLEPFRRHPAGTFDLGYSEDAGGYNTDFYDVTLYIVQNSAYKLHGGNRADQSDGCLLINYNSPQNDKYPEAFQYEDPDTKAKKSRPASERGNVVNTYYQHSDPNNPAYKLRKKIEEMEKEIKEKYKITTVVKRIVIDESNEKIEK